MRQAPILGLILAASVLSVGQGAAPPDDGWFDPRTLIEARMAPPLTSVIPVPGVIPGRGWPASHLLPDGKLYQPPPPPEPTDPLDREVRPRLIGAWSGYWKFRGGFKIDDGGAPRLVVLYEDHAIDYSPPPRLSLLRVTIHAAMRARDGLWVSRPIYETTGKSFLSMKYSGTAEELAVAFFRPMPRVVEDEWGVKVNVTDLRNVSRLRLRFKGGTLVAKWG